MAICERCGQEMLLGVGCTHALMVLTTDTGGEELLERVRYGQEGDDWGGGDERGACHDCAVRPGGYHHLNCDVERCPHCGGQAICCKHILATRPANGGPSAAGR